MKKFSRVKKTGVPAHSKRRRSLLGFTIVEVLIVLAIAGIILSIIFLAVPAMQRNRRNTSRKRDAQLLFAAVQECLSNHVNDFNACNEVSELPIDINNFSIYTGAHFGADCINWIVTGCAQTPPTVDEPNWLNHLICLDGGNLASTNESYKFVIGYVVEQHNGAGYGTIIPPGYTGRCM